MVSKLVADLRALYRHRCASAEPITFESKDRETFEELAKHVCKFDSDRLRSLSFNCDNNDEAGEDVGNKFKAKVQNGSVTLTNTTTTTKTVFELRNLVNDINSQLDEMNVKFKQVTNLPLCAMVVTGDHRYAMFTDRQKYVLYYKELRQEEMTNARLNNEWLQLRKGEEDEVVQKFGTECAKNAPIDVTSLQKLVASSLPTPREKKHEHAALANIVWSMELNRYFSPEELIFFDVYSRAGTQLAKFRELYASYPPYWSSFASVDSGKCTPNQWTVHVGTPRGWTAWFSDTLRKPVDVWNSFIVQKARHDALTFYELLRLKLEIQPRLETSKWVLLYSIKLVLEWTGPLLQRVLAAFEWLNAKTSAGNKAKSLLGWMTTTFSMGLSRARFPDVVLTPLGYGAAFIGNAGALVGAVPIVLWKQRHTLYEQYKKEVQYISNQLAPKKQPLPSTEPPKTPIEMLWDIVQTEFKMKGKKDMSSRGYYALQEACELAKNTTTTHDTTTTPTPTTN